MRVSDLLPSNSETCEPGDRWLVKLFWFGGDGGWGGRDEVPGPRGVMGMEGLGVGGRFHLT